MPKNLLQKKDDELDRLRSAGLGMFYVGLETGNDILLKKVTKGATSKGIIYELSTGEKTWLYFIMHDNSRHRWKNLYL